MAFSISYANFKLLIFNYLEISFAFFLLHAGFLVEVNHTSCTFALCGSHHFLHNLFYCVSFTFYRSCERSSQEYGNVSSSFLFYLCTVQADGRRQA